MSWFDILALALFALVAWKGWGKGFIVELFTMIGLVAGIAAAFLFMDEMLLWILKNSGADSLLLPLVAFILVFVIVFLLVHFLGKFLKTLISLTPLGIFDAAAGMLLAVIRAVASIGLILWSFNAARVTIPFEWVKDSYLYEPILWVGTTLAGWLDFGFDWESIRKVVEGIGTGVM